MLLSDLVSQLRSGDSTLINYDLAQNPNILNGASLEKAKKGQISFIEKDSYLMNEFNSSNASAIVIPDEAKLVEQVKKKDVAWLIVEDPRLAFAEILELLNPTCKPTSGIHPSAVIGENVTIGEGVSIGANVSIGNKVQIAKNSMIHPGVVIYDGVEIGFHSELHANCVIHRNSLIGNNCIINSNAVIGSEGFGFIPTKKGWRKMPQTGNVVLENNVEIGAGSTIDRPAVGETRVGHGTKIDNLVQIGHGVIIGTSCAMASQVGIAGGATIGNGVILAGQVGVGNRVVVSDGVIASSKCGIHADVGPGEIVSGFPAIPNKHWLRCSANFKKLPDLAKSLKELKKKITAED